eukprot:TRINITY_DN51071_c0_g1_i1.p1 TRINITY_DN51071_c0_g1~~TRINITY_DN51071_c0_g1_i1.p1  ORF type:complete len:414 (-),score=74.79 TRINITY_DN51071_c0_g1_i1:19-1221(-)
MVWIWTTVALMHSIALSSICAGTALGSVLDKYFAKHEDLEVTEIDVLQACCIPLMASASLLLLFYFFAHVQSLVVLGAAWASYTCVFGTLAGTLHSMSSSLPDRCIMGTSAVVAAVVLCLWVLTNHWAVVNLMAFCISSVSIAAVRLKSLKVAVIAGIGLFVYDVFWVFFSEHFFKENVMVKVASQSATNPLHTMAKAAGAPIVEHVARELSLPAKLVVPIIGSDESSGGGFLLGLGDITVPGIFVAYAHHLDMCVSRSLKDPHRKWLPVELEEGAFRQGQQADKSRSTCRHAILSFFCFVVARPYCVTALLGYEGGFCMALVALLTFQVAQPALFYVVPACVVPFAVLSCCRGHFGIAWSGDVMSSEEDGRVLEQVPQLLGRSVAQGRLRHPQPIDSSG